MFRARGCDDRWTDEQFLHAACDAMVVELDWDSLDSGRLHHATSAAKTLTGISVVVGVLDRSDCLETFLHDANEEKRYSELPPNTPVWLYIPSGIPLPSDLPEMVVVKSIPSPS